MDGVQLDLTTMDGQTKRQKKTTMHNPQKMKTHSEPLETPRRFLPSDVKGPTYIIRSEHYFDQLHAIFFAMIYIHAGEKATEEAVQFFVHVYLLSINGLTSSLIRRRRQGMNLSFVKLRRLVIDMKMISCHHNHATLFCTLLPVRVINFTVSYCTKKSVDRRQLQTFSSYVKQLLYEQFETIYST